MAKTYRLNPCDCLFHAFDCQLKQHGYPGAAMFLVFDVVGPLDPDRVREGFRRAMQAHPTTMAASVISFWRAWLYWRYDGTPLPPRYRHHDLADCADWEATVERLTQECFTSPFDPSRPPLIRLEHYEGPDNRHRLCFIFPHSWGDVEGAQYFVAEIDRLAADDPAPYPDYLLEDHERVDPLAEYGPLRRLRMVAQVLRASAHQAPVHKVSLLDSLPERPVASRRARYLRRVWTPEVMARLRDNARKITPPGPALYSRYLAGCVLRAIYRIHAEHGRTLPSYGMMFPMRLPGLGRRPIPGNYLVSATLHVSPERITDKRTVLEDVNRQLGDFHAHRVDLASWALLWLTTKLRTGQYRKLIGMLTRMQPFATGYSFFNHIGPPLERFVGAEVTDFWAIGVVSIPPGWNPVFVKFRDRITFLVAWPDGSFPEDVVQRYADLIEEEALGE